MEESQNSLSDDIKEQTDKYQKKANDLLKKSDTTEKEVLNLLKKLGINLYINLNMKKLKRNCLMENLLKLLKKKISILYSF